MPLVAIGKESHLPGWNGVHMIEEKWKPKKVPMVETDWRERVSSVKETVNKALANLVVDSNSRIASFLSQFGFVQQGSVDRWEPLGLIISKTEARLSNNNHSLYPLIGSEVTKIIGVCKFLHGGNQP